VAANVGTPYELKMTTQTIGHTEYAF